MENLEKDSLTWLDSQSGLASACAGTTWSGGTLVIKTCIPLGQLNYTGIFTENSRKYLNWQL